jgi:hypothetical protein
MAFLRETDARSSAILSRGDTHTHALNVHRAVDFSDSSREALRTAAELARTSQTSSLGCSHAARGPQIAVLPVARR